MTIAGQLRATVKDGPLPREEVIARSGLSRKRAVQYLLKSLNQGLLVEREGLIAFGRLAQRDDTAGQAARKVARLARNAQAKRDRRAARGALPRPIRAKLSPEELRDRHNAARRRKRAATRPQPAPTPVTVAPKPKPPHKPAQAVRRTSLIGITDCAKSKPEPTRHPIPDTEAFVRAHPERLTVIPTPPPAPWTTMPVRRTFAGARGL